MAYKTSRTTEANQLTKLIKQVQEDLSNKIDEANSELKQFTFAIAIKVNEIDHRIEKLKTKIKN